VPKRWHQNLTKAEKMIAIFQPQLDQLCAFPSIRSTSAPEGHRWKGQRPALWSLLARVDALRPS